MTCLHCNHTCKGPLCSQCRDRQERVPPCPRCQSRRAVMEAGFWNGKLWWCMDCRERFVEEA
jgi:hypothetical protein